MTAPPSAADHGLALLRQGRAGEAAAVLQAHLRQAPGDARAWYLLGLAEHAAQRPAAALAAFERCHRLGARDPAQLANHAGLCLAAGDAGRALALAREALATAPALAPALLNGGLAAHALGDHEAAAAWLEAGLAQRPQALSARIAAVRSLLALARPGQALALALAPDLLAEAEPARQLALAFPLRDPDQTRLALLRALAARHPGHLPVSFDLAAALHIAGLGGDALALAESVLAGEPDNADAALMLASAWLERGQPAPALETLRALLDRRPDHDVAWANYLVALHYEPALGQDALLAEHHRWARVRLAGIRPRPPAGLVRDPDPGRPLRIGWLSPRLVQGAVMQFFAGLLPAFPAGRAVHVVYHDHPGGDAATAAVRAQADAFHAVAALDEAALAARMLDDRLDVLVDLAGHAPNNRLRVLAGRVAPVQLSWYDYVDTLAVPAIDAVLMDAVMAPPGSERWLAEPVLRLAPCRQAFVPPDDAPPPTWAGAADAPFTLACFNRMPKRNPAVFDRYAAALAALPQARLLLLDAALEGPQTRAAVESALAARGVDLARVELRGRQPYRDLLAAYRAVDVVLDPFPYSGCTSTCDALWMGVPVFGTRGTTFAARQSAMFLETIGRGDWLFADQPALLDGLVRLAADPARRGSSARSALRERMRVQVCDPAPLAASLEAVIRELWRQRCTQASGAGPA